MGQYHMIVNLTKKQFLHPHKFGEGLKLMEFGCDAMGVLTGLTILLADSNDRGGGDFRVEDPLVGSWAGDRIVITGDYGDNGKWLDTLSAEQTAALQNRKDTNLYSALEVFTDISEEVVKMMQKDEYLKEHMIQRPQKKG